VSIEWSQVSALGVIAAAVAVCIVLVFGVVGLVRRVWTWVAGDRRLRETSKVSTTPEAILAGGVVTASDIFAIRSNLAAVSRQLEDLESKLRLNPPKR
jgi:hypothetical protein